MQRVANDHEIRAMIAGFQRTATKHELIDFIRPRQRAMSPGEFDRDRFYRRMV
jgi:hypothetical protein